MANRVGSGKGSVPGSDSKVLGEKRVGGELGFEDELDSRKRIKMRDLDSVCRAEGISNKQPGGHVQLYDEEMSEIIEVPVTSDADASRAGKAVRTTFPIALNLIPKSPDLNNDVCIAKSKVLNGSQQCFRSSEQTMSPKDQVTDLGKSVRSTIPAVVNLISKPQNLNTDACIANSTFHNGSKQCSKSSEKITLPRDQVTEVHKTSNLDASRVGTSVRSTIPAMVNPISKPLDLKTDARIGRTVVQNGSQQCSQSSEKTTLPGKQVIEVPKTPDLYASQTGTAMRRTIPVVVNPVPRPIDLNTDSCIASSVVQYGSRQCSQNLEKSTVLRDHDKGNAVDLIVKGVSSSENQDPFYPYKNLNYLKPRDVSECGSCTGPLEEKDPMTVWKEMKQNGFLSSTHGGISKPKQPVAVPTPKQQHGSISTSKQQGSIPMSKQHGGIPMPKPRLKKNKSEEQKKKVERAKKEQVDRFAKIAAPSGLLNELNPGIINHVRNRKQVHSIIEALVRSERLEISRVENKQTTHQQSETAESSQGLDSMREGWHPSTFFEDMQAQGYTILMNKPSFGQVDNSIESDPTAKESFGGISFASHPTTLFSEEELLALKVSSSNVAPDEDSSLLSKEETTSYLSFKAATVASQWLELIQQDIQGRLSALQRSRKRVRNVITTDLPLLLKKEFLSDKENDSSFIKSSVDGLSSHACAEMHRARWGPRFDQMDKALFEEEEQLESWLKQVREMKAHCNKGLQLISCSSGVQALGTSENDSRHMTDSSQREVAVRAAAASIYATCNFILSANASPCC